MKEGADVRARHMPSAGRASWSGCPKLKSEEGWLTPEQHREQSGCHIVVVVVGYVRVFAARVVEEEITPSVFC